jgi:acyl transferase domain-containing protein
VLVLKRFYPAINSGDKIHGQVRAFASAHNGATRTMFTPSAKAQAALTRRALSAGRVAANDIDIFEGSFLCFYYVVVT